MTRDELGSRVRAIISEHIANTYSADHGGARVVTDASQLAEDLKLDSLDCMEIVLEAEDEFDVELEDDKLAAITTVSELANYLAGKLGIVEVAA